MNSGKYSKSLQEIGCLALPLPISVSGLSVSRTTVESAPLLITNGLRGHDSSYLGEESSCAGEIITILRAMNGEEVRLFVKRLQINAEKLDDK